MRALLVPFVVAVCLAMPALQPVRADEAKLDGARNCVSTRRLKSTAVIDDMNILFVMIGNRIFHNRLPRQCAGLAREGRFSYRTLSGSICRHDTVRVLQASSDMGGRTCSLGYFYPVAKEDLQGLVEGVRGSVKIDQPPTAEVEEIGDEPQETNRDEEDAPQR